jgi:hypothetical protein
VIAVFVDADGKWLFILREGLSGLKYFFHTMNPFGSVRRDHGVWSSENFILRHPDCFGSGLVEKNKSELGPFIDPYR